MKKYPQDAAGDNIKIDGFLLKIPPESDGLLEADRGRATRGYIYLKVLLLHTCGLFLYSQWQWFCFTLRWRSTAAMRTWASGGCLVAYPCVDGWENLKQLGGCWNLLSAVKKSVEISWA